MEKIDQKPSNLKNEIRLSMQNKVLFELFNTQYKLTIPGNIPNQYLKVVLGIANFWIKNDKIKRLILLEKSNNSKINYLVVLEQTEKKTEYLNISGVSVQINIISDEEYLSLLGNGHQNIDNGFTIFEK